MILQRFRRTAPVRTKAVQPPQPDEVAYAAVLSELAAGHTPDLEAIPEGPSRVAALGLQSVMKDARLTDLSNLARLSMQPSEAAINVCWTTHDVGPIAGSSKAIASTTEELVASSSGAEGILGRRVCGQTPSGGNGGGGGRRRLDTGTPAYGAMADAIDDMLAHARRLLKFRAARPGSVDATGHA
jgi:hypothetical protein